MKITREDSSLLYRIEDRNLVARPYRDFIERNRARLASADFDPIASLSEHAELKAELGSDWVRAFEELERLRLRFVTFLTTYVRSLTAKLLDGCSELLADEADRLRAPESREELIRTVAEVSKGRSLRSASRRFPMLAAPWIERGAAWQTHRWMLPGKRRQHLEDWVQRFFEASRVQLASCRSALERNPGDFLTSRVLTTGAFVSLGMMSGSLFIELFDASLRLRPIAIEALPPAEVFIERLFEAANLGWQVDLSWSPACHRDVPLASSLRDFRARVACLATAGTWPAAQAIAADAPEALFLALDLIEHFGAQAAYPTVVTLFERLKDPALATLESMKRGREPSTS